MPKTKLTYHTQHGDGNGNGIRGIYLIRVVARAYFTYTYTYTHTNEHALVSPEMKMPARRTLRLARRPRQGTSALCAESPSLPVAVALAVAAVAVVPSASARSYSANRSANNSASVQACVCVCVSTVCAATVALFQVYWLTSVKGSTY